jgi:hypothetical protein
VEPHRVGSDSTGSLREAQKSPGRKILELWKYFVTANDFPRHFRKIVWQWRAVQGNSWTNISGDLGTWVAAGEPGIIWFKMQHQCHGPHQMRLGDLKLHPHNGLFVEMHHLLETAFWWLKSRIMWVYLLVCLVWKKTEVERKVTEESGKPEKVSGKMDD